MLKKKLTKEECISLAKDLSLTTYIDVCNLIDALNIEQTKETKVCLLTTNKEVVETILSEYFDISASLYVDSVAKVSVQYGDENYTAITEYGEMFVDKDGFVKVLGTRQNRIDCSLMTRNELLKNILLNIIYVPEYNKIDDDSWRCTLLESDELIMVLSASHILYTGEKDFINTFVLPYYSSARLYFAIGNAQHIKSVEWSDAIMRVKLQLGDIYDAFPIFTEIVSEERKQRYSGNDVSLGTLLAEAQKNSLALRVSHCKDLDAYKDNLLENQLEQLRVKMEQVQSSGESSVLQAGENEEQIANSKKHIEDNISLFIESPLLSQIRTATNSFTKLFIASLKEDIDASTDIKQDARSLTRYLSEIWERFSEDQNTVLFHEFEREASMLFEMMRLDLRHITRNIQNVEIQESIRKKLENAFSVNTFFSRKTTPGNGLTDALTIGGIIAGIFATPLGWAAVLASEVIKVVGKESMNNEYKETLKVKIEETIEKNQEDILCQAEKRFKQVSQDFRDEMMKCYDDLITSINQIIQEEGERVAKASSILETINSLI